MTTINEPTPFPEHPVKPPEPPIDCLCRGWGIKLGTDTPDSWGEASECGHPYHQPATVMEAQDLHTAHMQARLRAAVQQ